MGVSLVDRVNSIKATPQKSISFGSVWSSIVGTLASRNIDLTDTKYSVALAYVFIEPVRTCIDLYAQAVPQIPQNIIYNQTHDRKNDEIQASSDDVGVSRLPIMEVFNDHRRNYSINFFEALTYETMLFGASAVELLRPENEVLAQIAINNNRVTGLKVLRGIGLTVQAYSGAIQWFQYQDDTGSVMLNPSDVAYDKGYNPFNDYLGLPLVYAILDELNIFNDLRRFLSRFLQKADRPDVYASFKDGAFSANTQAMNAFQEMLRKYKESNATFFTGNIPVDFTAIPAGQANDQMQVNEATKASIFEAFGVPQALVGNNQATTYQEGNNAYANWVRVKVKPLLSTIEAFINDNLLERFGMDRYYRFEFDPSKYEFVTEDDKIAIDAANAKLESGGYTYKQWANELGVDYDEKFADWYKIEGIPVPPDALTELWRYKWQAPASEQLAQAELNSRQADVAQVEAETPVTTTTPMEDVATPVTDITEQPDESLPTQQVTLSMLDDSDGKKISYTTTLDKLHITHDHEASIKSFTPRKESRDKELSAYKKVAFKNYKRDFPLEWLAGDIGDKLSADIAVSKGDTAQIAKAFEIATASINQYHKRFEKSLSETKISFQEDFASLMRKALEPDNNYGRVQWASGVRSIIRRYGTQAYKDGLIEGGVFDASLDDNDIDTISSLISEQSQYVTNLGDTIFKQGGVSEALAILKPEIWWNRSMKQFYEAGLLSADKGGMYEFTGHDGNESCITCQTLKGQRHRLKEWTRRGLRPSVDSENFECGLWNCEHFLRKVFAQSSGSWLA